MARIDWSVLSGPRVSRRTLLNLAAASGAAAYAGRLAIADAAPAPPSHAKRRAFRQGEPKTGGTLNYGFGISQIPNLDPAKVNLGAVAGGILPLIFSSLVQFDAQLGLIPDLAEKWTVSEDGLVYTFTLRDGLTFQNGDPLKAKDIIFTYERAIDPDFASPHANKLAAITSAETPDDLTVVLTLEAPFAPFLAVACSRGPGRALTPVSPRAFEEMGAEKFDLAPVGAGPFSLVAEGADLSSGFKLAAFDGYYNGRPFLDEIDVTIIAEPSSRISALEAGDVDMLDIVPAIGVAQLQENPDLMLVQSPGTSWLGLAMNFTRPPWDKPEARMAVAKAINRDDLIQTAMFGLPKPSIGAIAPAFAWAYIPPDQTETPQAFNLDEAKALAESAGIGGAKPTIMGTPDDRRPGMSAGSLETSTGSSTGASPTPIRTTATGTSSSRKGRGIPTSTTTPRLTPYSWRLAPREIKKSARTCSTRSRRSSNGMSRTPSSITRSIRPGSATTSRAITRSRKCGSWRPSGSIDKS